MYNIQISDLATVLDVRRNRNGVTEAYVSYAGKDKRLDAWIEEKELGEEIAGPSKVLSSEIQTGSNSAPIRDTSEAPESSKRAATSPSVESSPEREHATLTRVRNFEDVRFGEYLIKTWLVNLWHPDSCRTRELTERKKGTIHLTRYPTRRVLRRLLMRHFHHLGNVNSPIQMARLHPWSPNLALIVLPTELLPRTRCSIPVNRKWVEQ